MLRSRIIPCLLIQNNGLVKTVQFNASKYVGDPINAVRIFNEKEVDELMVLDIDATVNNQPPNYTMIEQLAAECRMPLSYGGGVRTVEQAKKIIQLGVEKVSMSSAAIHNPELISIFAHDLGRQSVVVVLDVKKNIKLNRYEVYTHRGKTLVNQDFLELVRSLEAHGVGEIVINSIDRDGMMGGYDLELVNQVRHAIRVPMTVLGGAGHLNDIKQLVSQCGIIGAAAGSLFVFKGVYRAVLINYPSRAQKNDILSLSECFSDFLSP